MSLFQVFDSFIDSILVVDGEGKTRYGNSAAAILTGLSAKRIAGGRALDQVITFETDPFDGSLEALVECTQMREVAFGLSDGRKGSGQIIIQPAPSHMLESADEKRWILYLHDITIEKTLHDKYRGELDQKESVIRDLEVARGELEKYSKNLEKMVGDRTSELSETNRLLKTILDSLGQGILVFSRDGKCLPIYSQVCVRLLGCDPLDRTIEEVMGLSGKDQTNFEKWREAVFDELLDFRDMVPLAPQRLSHSAGLEIALDYHPMHDNAGHLQGIVVVATDKTMEFRALRKAASEREMVSKVTQVARNREMFRLFVIEGRKLLAELKRPETLDTVDLARRLHTLKGSAASFSLTEVADACHRMEDELKKAAGSDLKAFYRAMKAEADKINAQLDRELSMLGELLGPIGVDSGMQMVEIPLTMLRDWSKALISGVTIPRAQEIGIKILKESSEKSVGVSVQHLGPSLVELAESMGKKLAAFDVIGAETKVPAHFGQSLLSSLVHAFRNSIYHGLEEPAERLARNKPEAGRIRATFEKVGDTRPALVITIEDDGRGVNPAAIRSKLIGQGLEAQASGTDEQVIQAILRDDVSTAKEVTSVAGRGVGMGAIAAEARRLGGTVVVTSVLNQGMKLTIHVPYPRAANEPSSNAA